MGHRLTIGEQDIGRGGAFRGIFVGLRGSVSNPVIPVQVTMLVTLPLDAADTFVSSLLELRDVCFLGELVRFARSRVLPLRWQVERVILMLHWERFPWHSLSVFGASIVSPRLITYPSGSGLSPYGYIPFGDPVLHPTHHCDDNVSRQFHPQRVCLPCTHRSDSCMSRMISHSSNP